MDLRDKTVLITGASSGIGYAIARALAGQGAVLAVAARNQDRLDALADAIEAGGYRRPIVFATDLSKPGSAEDLAVRTLAVLGHVDVLINNAAMEGVGEYATAGDDGASRALFEANYWAPMALVGALVPAMRSRGSGAVMNVSSLGAITPIAGTGHYASSKAALAIATEALRAELRGSGVQVHLVYPGFVDTPMLRAFSARADLPATLRRRLRWMPVGQAEGLAKLVVKALRRDRAIVVYPRSYGVTPLIPALSRWFTTRLFASPRPAAPLGAEPRQCCRWTVLLRRHCARTGPAAA